MFRNLAAIALVFADRRLDVLLRDLQSDDYTTRTTAETTLAETREAAQDAIEQKIKTTQDLEDRLRLERLLARLGQRSLRSLRDHRAVLLLEACASSEARKLLRTLAQGLPQARLTQEAREALGRMKVRSE